MLTFRRFLGCELQMMLLHSPVNIIYQLIMVPVKGQQSSASNIHASSSRECTVHY